MAARRKNTKRVRLVFQRSSPKLKILVIATLIFCTVALLALSIGIRITKDNIESLRQEAAGKEQSNAELREDISEFGTLKSIKELAKKLFGLVDPDTVILSPKG